MLYQQYLNHVSSKAMMQQLLKHLPVNMPNKRWYNNRRLCTHRGLLSRLVYAQPAKKSGLGTVGIVSVAIVGIVALVIILSAMYVWASSLAVENAVES